MSDWNGFKLIKGAVEKTALDLDIIMRDGASDPVLPPTVDRTMTIPGRNGVHYFGADIGARRINIPCAFVYASTSTQMQTHIETLADFLIDTDSKPTKLELIYEDNPTKAYWVYYSGMIGITRIVFDREFDLQFIAPDPIAHAKGA